MYEQEDTTFGVEAAEKMYQTSFPFIQLFTEKLEALGNDGAHDKKMELAVELIAFAEVTARVGFLASLGGAADATARTGVFLDAVAKTITGKLMKTSQTPGTEPLIALAIFSELMKQIKESDVFYSRLWSTALQSGSPDAESAALRAFAERAASILKCPEDPTVIELGIMLATLYLDELDSQTAAKISR
jgi:hypothetical protein